MTLITNRHIVQLPREGCRRGRSQQFLRCPHGCCIQGTSTSTLTKGVWCSITPPVRSWCSWQPPPREPDECPANGHRDRDQKGRHDQPTSDQPVNESSRCATLYPDENQDNFQQPRSRSAVPHKLRPIADRYGQNKQFGWKRSLAAYPESAKLECKREECRIAYLARVRSWQFVQQQTHRWIRSSRCRYGCQAEDLYGSQQYQNNRSRGTMFLTCSGSHIPTIEEIARRTKLRRKQCGPERIHQQPAGSRRNPNWTASSPSTTGSCFACSSYQVRCGPKLPSGTKPIACSNPLATIFALARQKRPNRRWPGPGKLVKPLSDLPEHLASKSTVCTAQTWPQCCCYQDTEPCPDGGRCIDRNPNCQRLGADYQLFLWSHLRTVQQTYPYGGLISNIQRRVQIFSLEVSDRLWPSETSSRGNCRKGTATIGLVSRAVLPLR